MTHAFPTRRSADLDRGGSCHGMAFRVPAAEGEEALDYLFEREMMTGIYRASWRSAETREGLIRAMAFVVDRRHRQYAGALDHDSVVALILQGRGDRGPRSEEHTSELQSLMRN